MPKITYIISNIDKAFEFEWAAKELKSLGYTMNFILLNKGSSKLQEFLIGIDIDCKTIGFHNKYDIPLVIPKIFRLLLKVRPDIVHCHLFEASIAGLLAAKLAGIKNSIHTRHHSTWHHKYFKSAIKYDKLNNVLSRKIIAISGVVKSLLLEEGAPEDKIEIVYHGIDRERFKEVNDMRISTLAAKYNIDIKYPVVGVISRYTIWKGIQYIIPAFKMFLGKYPDAVLLLANARGDYKPSIKHLLNEIPPRNYREIEFETDLFALYKLFTIFVHVPIDSSSEAFGQVYIESLAAGVPMICTKSGIGCDILINKFNAYIVDYENSKEIYEALSILMNHNELKKTIIQNGFQTVAQYSLNHKVMKLDQIYKGLLKNE